MEWINSIAGAAITVNQKYGIVVSSQLNKEVHKISKVFLKSVKLYQLRNFSTPSNIDN